MGCWGGPEGAPTILAALYLPPSLTVKFRALKTKPDRTYPTYVPDPLEPPSHLTHPPI